MNWTALFAYIGVLFGALSVMVAFLLWPWLLIIAFIVGLVCCLQTRVPITTKVTPEDDSDLVMFL